MSTLRTTQHGAWQAARLPHAVLLAAALAAAAGIAGHADGPRLHAITGARIVTASGAPIESGTVLIRNGFIEAVGAAVTVPPEATVIEAKGMTVYPGLIDMGATAGLDVATSQPPANARTRAEVERWKRQNILRPQAEAANLVKADAPELKRLASFGITTVLAVPPGEVVRGHSALVNVAVAEEAPQVGNIVDERRGLHVVRSPVALHVAFAETTRGTGYPQSLMGVIGFVRQAFLDAQHYQAELAHYERAKPGTPQPVHDPALEALQRALAGKVPVVMQADSAREIRRVLAFATEFKLDPIVNGAREAPDVAADLKAAKARVIFSLNFPVRSRMLAPDADESVETLRSRANTPKAPAELDKAGILFAFTSGGLRDPADFVRNAAKAVKAGLSPESAIKALTLNAATIAGVAGRLGSIEKGKIANLVVTDGDLFEEKTKVKHVFIDGNPVRIETTPAPRRGT